MIPAQIIADLGLKAGSAVNVELKNGKIVLTPISKPSLPRYSEKELLAGLTAESAHADEIAEVSDTDLPGVTW